jgi:dTDP-glucose 4,6-dehydratase/UDP-glucose 4-epimerase
MKVVIIGSEGFIGKHLHSYMRAQGHEVWGADVVTRYVDPENYFLMDSSNSDFSSVFRNTQYDLCVNCSGAASVPDSMENPIRDYYLNAVNVFKLLDSIRSEQDHCRFINLSSAAVYGNPEQLPVSESALPNPLSPYGLHKLHSEQICREFYDFHQVPTCSLRIFSVYGPGLQKQLFWDLLKKANSGEAIKLFGTGRESRDFIYISDLVRVIDLVYQRSDFQADVINVANGEEVFIQDAVSVFFGLFEQDISYTFSGDSRKGDPVNWKADISKLKGFGYKASVDMPEGLKAFYNHNKI